MEEKKLTPEAAMGVWERVTAPPSRPPVLPPPRPPQSPPPDRPGPRPPWDRPPAERPPERPEPGEERALRELMTEISTASEAYRAMAKRTRGRPEAMTFSRLAADWDRLLRLLEGIWFTRTGDLFYPRPAAEPAGGLLSDVRRCLLAEREMEKTASLLEKRAEDGHEAAIFRETARTARRHAAALTAIIERQMTR